MIKPLRHRLQALLALAGIGLGIWSLLILEAPGAWAGDVTNPAQHPYPVTVTIDGQTYHDGLDTLPGYDDYACTPIPDVQYDFADNEVLYYDDDGNLLATAPWTEWSRISSYKTWQAQQAAAGSSGSTPSKGSTGTSKSGSKTSTSTSKGTSSTSSGGSTRTPSSSKSASATPTTDPTAQASASSTATPKGHHANKTHAPAAGSQPGSTPDAQAPVAAVLTTEKLSKGVSSGLGLGAGNTRTTGFAVLGGLGVASLAVWIAGFIRGHGPRRRRTSGIS